MFCSLIVIAIFTSSVAAQFPYAVISWSEPKSPTTNNVLIPTTFKLYAGLYQGIRMWDHGFTDSTDYDQEVMFWADLGDDFKIHVPWQVAYYVEAFLAVDSLNGDLWVVFSEVKVLHHGAGPGGVEGTITWKYWH